MLHPLLTLPHFFQEKTELQEKAQHLRQRSADMLQENNT